MSLTLTGNFSSSSSSSQFNERNLIEERSLEGANRRPFHNLARVVILLNLSYLSYQDLSQIALLSRAMKSCSEDNFLWAKLCGDHAITLKGKEFGIAKNQFKRALLEKEIIEGYEVQFNSWTEHDPRGYFETGRPNLNEIWFKKVIEYVKMGGDPHLALTSAHPQPQDLMGVVVDDHIASTSKDGETMGENCTLALEVILNSPQKNIDYIRPGASFSALQKAYTNFYMSKLVYKLLEKTEDSPQAVQLRLDRAARVSSVDYDSVRLLQEKGADISWRDDQGRPFILRACQTNASAMSCIYPAVKRDYLQKTLEVCNMVRSFPWDVTASIMSYRGLEDYFSVTDNEGNNILHLLDEFSISNENSFKLLLEETGHLICKKNHQGQTPLQEAVKSNSPILVAIFLKEKTLSLASIQEALKIHQNFFTGSRDSSLVGHLRAQNYVKIGELLKDAIAVRRVSSCSLRSLLSASLSGLSSTDSTDSTHYLVSSANCICTLPFHQMMNRL